ncbi:hypothetical protein C8R43DRAFT_950835 [Mycena crocata]|nr:hypothetical protein C8R43DRAFT_950835 [Mycena crocata]
MAAPNPHDINPLHSRKQFYAYSLPRLPSFLSYDTPFVETSINFDLSRLGPPRSGRSIVVAGRQYRLESPNSSQTPYYPGSGAQVAEAGHLPIQRRFDGQLGPGDYSLSPQFFCPEKPWLPFICREDELLAQLDVEPSHVTVHDIWITEAGANYRGRLKQRWIQSLIIQHVAANSAVFAIKQDTLLHSSLPSCMQDAHIFWPHEQDLVSLYQITLYEDAVDWVRCYQRALLCKRAWVYMARNWHAHSTEHDTVARHSRRANDELIGVYLNGGQIPAPYVNWYLSLGVPCFYLIDFVDKPLPAPIHLSFSTGTPIQALMSPSTYLYDELADRDGCEVAAAGYRWPGDKWTQARITTMRGHLGRRYPGQFIASEYLPDPQSASLLKRIDEKKRRPLRQVISCMRPQQPKCQEPEVESDSGSRPDGTRGTPDGNPPNGKAPPPDLSLRFPKNARGAVKLTDRDFDILRRYTTFLNDKLIELFLKLRFAELTRERPGLSSNIYIASSFLFTRYQSSKYSAVKTWTDQISGLYTKRITLIPINQALHWFLAIFVPSKKESRLWILDSKGWKHPKAVGVLLDYLKDEAKERGVAANVPTVDYVEVPLQRGDVLCGDNLIHLAGMFLQDPDFYLGKFNASISTSDMWQKPGNLRTWLRKRMDQLIDAEYQHLRPALAQFTPSESIEIDDSDDEVIEIDDEPTLVHDTNQQGAISFKPASSAIEPQEDAMDVDTPSLHATAALDDGPIATHEAGRQSANIPREGGVDCGQVLADNTSSAAEVQENAMDVDLPDHITDIPGLFVGDESIVTHDSDGQGVDVRGDHGVGCGQAPSEDDLAVAEAQGDAMDTDVTNIAGILTHDLNGQDVNAHRVDDVGCTQAPSENDLAAAEAQEDAMNTHESGRQNAGGGVDFAQVPSENASSAAEAKGDATDMDLANHITGIPGLLLGDEPAFVHDSDAPKVDVGCAEASSGDDLTVAEAQGDAMNTDVTDIAGLPDPHATPPFGDEHFAAVQVQQQHDSDGQDASARRVDDVGCAQAPSDNDLVAHEAQEDPINAGLPDVADIPGLHAAFPLSGQPIVVHGWNEQDAVWGVDERVDCARAPYENAPTAQGDAIDMDAPAADIPRPCAAALPGIDGAPSCGVVSMDIDKRMTGRVTKEERAAPEWSPNILVTQDWRSSPLVAGLPQDTDSSDIIAASTLNPATSTPAPAPSPRTSAPSRSDASPPLSFEPGAHSPPGPSVGRGSPPPPGPRAMLGPGTKPPPSDPRAMSAHGAHPPSGPLAHASRAAPYPPQGRSADPAAPHGRRKHRKRGKGAELKRENFKKNTYGNIPYPDSPPSVRPVRDGDGILHDVGRFSFLTTSTSSVAAQNLLAPGLLLPPPRPPPHITNASDASAPLRSSLALRVIKSARALLRRLTAPIAKPQRSVVAGAHSVSRHFVSLHSLGSPLWLSHRPGAGRLLCGFFPYFNDGPLQASRLRLSCGKSLRLPIEEQILIHSTRRLYQRIKGDIYAVKRIINVWDPTTASVIPITRLKIGLSTNVPRRQQNYREKWRCTDIKRIERLAHLTLRRSGAVADHAQCTCIVCHQEFYNLKGLSTEDALKMVDGWVKTTRTGSGRALQSSLSAPEIQNLTRHWSEQERASLPVSKTSVQRIPIRAGPSATVANIRRASVPQATSSVRTFVWPTLCTLLMPPTSQQAASLHIHSLPGNERLDHWLVAFLAFVIHLSFGHTNTGNATLTATFERSAPSPTSYLARVRSSAAIILPFQCKLLSAPADLAAHFPYNQLVLTQPRLLDRVGRAIARKVHKDGSGVPLQRIGSVCCVSTDAVEKALRNDDDDNLDDDVKFIEQYCRELFNPAEAQVSMTSRYSTRSRPLNGEQPSSVVTVSADSRSVDLDAAEQRSAEDADHDDHSSVELDAARHCSRESSPQSTVEQDREFDELGSDADTEEHASGSDEAGDATSHDKSKQCGSRKRDAAIVTSHDRYKLFASRKRDARTDARVLRYAREDAGREYWPNPTADNFKTRTPISLPSDMGTRTPTKKLDRPGRGISRIMYKHDYAAALIGRIYSGVTHNVIMRCIKNEFFPPDDISDDYVKAGREYYDSFPPADGTFYVVPPEGDTGNNGETDKEDDGSHNEDDAHNTPPAGGNNRTTDTPYARDSLFTADEESDGDLLSNDDNFLEADGDSCAAARRMDSEECESACAIQSAGRHMQLGEASESPPRVKKEAECVPQRPNKRGHSVISISDDEPPPAKRKNTVQPIPFNNGGLKASSSGRNSARSVASLHGGVQVKVEGEDAKDLKAFLAAVPGGGLSRLYDVCQKKGVYSRRQLEGWVHLTELERLRNIRFLFGDHLNQFEIGMLDTGLLRLFATLCSRAAQPLPRHVTWGFRSGVTHIAGTIYAFNGALPPLV